MGDAVPLRPRHSRRGCGIHREATLSISDLMTYYVCLSVGKREPSGSLGPIV